MERNEYSKDMNTFSRAKHRILQIEEDASHDYFITRLHPLVKLIATILFIVATISINKYNISKLLYLIIYPISLIMMSNVPIKPAFKLIILVSPFLIFSGISNIILDKKIIFTINSLKITGGMLSFTTLLIKNIYSIFACYILISTTGIWRLCYALKLLHIPDIMINQILLTYRYIFVLTDRADQMYQSYLLRAPRQKGIHYKVWKSFLGSLWMHSLKRADGLYESMLLRGYNNENIYYYSKIKLRTIDISYLLFWILFFALVLFCL